MNILPEQQRWINREARNCFGGGVGNRTLKYMSGYNHYGMKNTEINKELHIEDYLRYG